MAKDMRDWIKELDAAGELLRIKKPVDPLHDMGALLWQSRQKALFFDSIMGYPGWRSIGQAPANLAQAALAFGVVLEGLIPEAARKLNALGSCALLKDGPVKEAKYFGAEVDLRKLPVHIGGTKDAGPFITSGLCITKNPQTGRKNMSFHRLQVKGPNRTGILMVPRHTSLNYRKYEEKGAPMPIAIMIGHHPMYYFAASTTGSYELDELELASSYLDEEVELVRCETIDLEVPAAAEIVLEAEVLPHYREPEGPFSEFQDYYIAGTGNNPVVDIKCVTMRKDAIFKNIQNGSEMEGCIYHKVPMSAQIFNRLKNIGGYVDLKNVLILPGIFSLVVQMNCRYFDEAKNVLMGALSSDYLHPKVAIAVDEDVNIFNYGEILWAISTRVNPARDIIVIPNTRIHPMDPTGEEVAPPGEEAWQRRGSKVIIDATKPPTCDAPRREAFERIKPMGYGEVFLNDYI